MQVYRIPEVNVFQPAKESVSMSGDADVSGFAKERSAANVPDCPIQRKVVCSL